jgi:hypothetical protein
VSEIIARAAVLAPAPELLVPPPQAASSSAAQHETIVTSPRASGREHS